MDLEVWVKLMPQAANCWSPRIQGLIPLPILVRVFFLPWYFTLIFSRSFLVIHEAICSILSITPSRVAEPHSPHLNPIRPITAKIADYDHGSSDSAHP